MSTATQLIRISRRVEVTHRIHWGPNLQSLGHHCYLRLGRPHWPFTLTLVEPFVVAHPLGRKEPKHTLERRNQKRHPAVASSAELVAINWCCFSLDEHPSRLQIAVTLRASLAHWRFFAWPLLAMY